MNTTLEFQFELLKETDKAIFAKVPYYEVTNEEAKKHKQLFYECWIPKYLLEKGSVKDFVMAKRNEMRLTNAFQRKQKMPESWKTLGEYAPIKNAHTLEVVDEEKVKELVATLESKYGATFRTLLNDEVGSKGDVSQEDLKFLSALYSCSMTNTLTPKKSKVIYK